MSFQLESDVDYEVRAVGLLAASAEDDVLAVPASEAVVRQFRVSEEGAEMVVNIRMPEVVKIYADRYGMATNG